MGFVNSAERAGRAPECRGQAGGEERLEQVRRAVRAAVSEELVCLGGNAGRVWILRARASSPVVEFVLCRAQGAVAEKGSVVDCPGAAVFGEKMRMRAERETTDFSVERCGE